MLDSFSVEGVEMMAGWREMLHTLLLDKVSTGVDEGAAQIKGMALEMTSYV